MVIAPRAHQVDFDHFHHRTGPYSGQNLMIGTLAWHGMGLGKTLEALWAARKQLALMRQMGVTNAKFMVIVPKSAIPTWKAECFKNCRDIYANMIIYPYSQLHNAVNMVRQVDIRFLVFDESHYMKSADTGRIQTVANFLETVGKTGNCFHYGRVFLGSGTPMPNGAHEIYTSWAICCAPTLVDAAARLRDPVRYENWKQTFSEKKTQKWERGRGKHKRTEYGSKFEGVANDDKLSQLLSPFVHFKRVSDCIDLPDKQEIPIDLGLPDDKLLKDANIEEPEAYMALLEKLARAKTPHMMNWVEDFLSGTDEQLLVFAMYRFPIEELAAKYPNQVRMITGAEKLAERTANLTDFQQGKFRILAMTFKAGSESLNLQNCTKSLYAGYPWTDATLQQAMARTYRQGQKNKTMHYFLTSGVNDMRILDIVLRKAEATSKVENLLLNASVNTNRIMSIDELI